jgi:hypothetical protein
MNLPSKFNPRALASALRKLPPQDQPRLPQQIE